MQINVEVRWALPGDGSRGPARFQGEVIWTFVDDRLYVRTDKLTLPGGTDVEVAEVSTVLVQTHITQTLFVAQL